MDAFGIGWQIRKGSTIELAGRHLRKIRRQRAGIAAQFAKMARLREDLIDLDASLAEAEEKTKRIVRRSR